ncbi:MAG: ABC transporter ATP-binding protein [Defluviitaleaceae bacterium]|nr:ABC transporter ATP-binding protein [Defluviitaleaceae bacterium]
MKDLLLKTENLSITFKTEGRFFNAVTGLNLEIHRNEVFAVVGESGCGKSATALAITKLHNPKHAQITGNIIFDGENLLEKTEAQLNKIRGRRISMIFQDPLTALNPLMPVGAQIEESLLLHTNFTRKQRKARALELLEAVGISNPPRVYAGYPFQLSGGMCQRVMIAVALSCNPELVIADEPTTALDVTIQAQILDLLRSLQKQTQVAIFLITHDLGVVAEIADKVAVMHAGKIVETGDVHQIFTNPRHDYTRLLLKHQMNFSAGQVADGYS